MNTPILVADVSDANSLALMAKKATVVVNCVGPVRYININLLLLLLHSLARRKFFCVCIFSIAFLVNKLSRHALKMVLVMLISAGNRR